MRPIKNLRHILAIAVLLVCSQFCSAQTRPSNASTNLGRNYYLSGLDAKGFTKNDYSSLKTSNAVKVYNLKQQEVRRMNTLTGDYFVPSFFVISLSVMNDTYKVRKPINYKLFYIAPKCFQTRKI